MQSASEIDEKLTHSLSLTHSPLSLFLSHSLDAKSAIRERTKHRNCVTNEHRMMTKRQKFVAQARTCALKCYFMLT